MPPAKPVLNGRQIPAVTEDDLRLFHATHFGSETLNAGTETHPDPDFLGYYSDGVERIITDEQIKMFRHSEIQALLLRRDNQDGEQNNFPNGTTTTKTAKESDDAAVLDSQEAQSDQKDASKRARKRRKKSNKSSTNNIDPSTWTHRRLAREHDEIKEEQIELDY